MCEGVERSAAGADDVVVAAMVVNQSVTVEQLGFNQSTTEAS